MRDVPCGSGAPGRKGEEEEEELGEEEIGQESSCRTEKEVGVVA